MFVRKLMLVLLSVCWLGVFTTPTQATSMVDTDYIAEYQNSVLVAAYKWNLEESCRDTDICHMYAAADMFNLGRGVFPKHRIPILKLHAGCRCYLSVLTVYDLDLNNQRQQIDQAGNLWLRSLSESERMQLFSKADYEVWRDTELWQPFMKHWRGVGEPHRGGSELLAMELNLRAPSDEFIRELAVIQGSRYTANKLGTDRFYDDEGQPVWPSNKGFYGKPKLKVLAVGVVVDKLGVRPRGKFLALPSVSRAQRAVPDRGQYAESYRMVHTFRTVAPLRVYVGLIAPWFDEVGMGIQYFVPQGIENAQELQLLNSGKTVRVSKDAA